MGQDIRLDAELRHFVEQLREPANVPQVGAGVEGGVERRDVGAGIGGDGDAAHAAEDGVKEAEGLGRATVVGGRGETADDGAPGLDVGEVPGAEHGAEDSEGVGGGAGPGGGNGEEAEGVGVEAVELALVAEATDKGAGAGEGGGGALVGELGEKAAEAGGSGKEGAAGVGLVGLVGPPLAEEGEQRGVVGAAPVHGQRGGEGVGGEVGSELGRSKGDGVEGFRGGVELKVGRDGGGHGRGRLLQHHDCCCCLTCRSV